LRVFILPFVVSKKQKREMGLRRCALAGLFLVVRLNAKYLEEDDEPGGSQACAEGKEACVEKGGCPKQTEDDPSFHVSFLQMQAKKVKKAAEAAGDTSGVGTEDPSLVPTHPNSVLTSVGEGRKSGKSAKRSRGPMISKGMKGARSKSARGGPSTAATPERTEGPFVDKEDLTVVLNSIPTPQTEDPTSVPKGKKSGKSSKKGKSSKSGSKSGKSSKKGKSSKSGSKSGKILSKKGGLPTDGDEDGDGDATPAPSPIWSDDWYYPDLSKAPAGDPSWVGTDDAKK